MMKISGTEDKLLLRAKLLVERPALSTTGTELDEVDDAKLGLWYTKWFGSWEPSTTFAWIKVGVLGDVETGADAWG
jgi:hypothetical protein